ncbi:HAD-IIB family hydrolase [Erysipelothrix urinaevulpis]|uniref:HAD-IIB family hydrolase n=1 Tax=Erysipelothrix urinaevulpis TaxID=2683717 RepID=UPI0013593BD0|nr:HAD family hydrolase [Erysipelothrix urinaevulpis]
MHKVVAFDLDSTLIDENNQIIGGKDTIDRLHQLHKLGFKLLVNTGRLDHDIQNICLQYHLPIDGRISQNGAVIYHNNKLQATLLDSSQALQFYDQVKDLSIRVEMNTISNRFWHSDRDPDFPKEFYDSSHIKADFKEIILNQPVVLFLLIGNKDEIESARQLVEQKFDQLDAVKTSETSLEILARGVSKGAALTQLFESMTLYAIGDSENDYSMFDIAEKAYLIGKDKHPKAKNIHEILDALDEILKIERQRP